MKLFRFYEKYVVHLNKESCCVVCQRYEKHTKMVSVWHLYNKMEEKQEQIMGPELFCPCLGPIK